MGKSSVVSRFNIPGKIGWAMMESPGFLTLLYIMFTLPKENDVKSLPMVNWLMAGLFVSHLRKYRASVSKSTVIGINGLIYKQTVHYIYRALLSPLLLNPSMSPIHLFVALSALSFQLFNATCLGGWLASYGPLTTADWAGHKLWIETGLIVFALGFLGNIYHDDELREIRRTAARDMKRREAEKGERRNDKGVDKVYMLPENGLFRVVLHPHYFCEWIEWCGFWMIGGLGCVPARCFVINEISTMLPRALHGKRWYIERFGKEKVGNRKAVIPGII